MLLAHLCSRGMELPGLAFLLVLTGGSVSVLQQEIDKFTLLWSRPQGKKEENLLGTGSTGQIPHSTKDEIKPGSYKTTGCS